MLSSSTGFLAQHSFYFVLGLIRIAREIPVSGSSHEDCHIYLSQSIFITVTPFHNFTAVSDSPFCVVLVGSLPVFTGRRSDKKWGLVTFHGTVLTGLDGAPDWIFEISPGICDHSIFGGELFCFYNAFSATLDSSWSETRLFSTFLS